MKIRASIVDTAKALAIAVPTMMAIYYIALLFVVATV